MIRNLEEIIKLTQGFKNFRDITQTHDEKRIYGKPRLITVNTKDLEKYCKQIGDINYLHKEKDMQKLGLKAVVAGMKLVDVLEYNIFTGFKAKINSPFFRDEQICVAPYFDLKTKKSGLDVKIVRNNKLIPGFDITLTNNEKEYKKKDFIYSSRIKLAEIKNKDPKLIALGQVSGFLYQTFKEFKKPKKLNRLIEQFEECKEEEKRFYKNAVKFVEMVSKNPVYRHKSIY
jgi:hypothetical protein